MRRHAPLAVVAAAMASLLWCGDARAQSDDAPKVEVGAQFTQLSLTPPDTFGTTNEPGFGLRLTYNLNDHVALEAEGNFYPKKSLDIGTLMGGRITQGQFGVKAGKRWNKFGVFAKARPGFISFGEVPTLTAIRTEVFNGIPFQTTDFAFLRKTHFSTDVGGVLEFYPSRRVMVRFDAGDTVIRYGKHRVVEFTPAGNLVFVERPAETKHNFQFSAGVGFRFRDGGGEQDSAPSDNSTDDTPRFEVAALFSSLMLDKPARFSYFPFNSEGERVDAESGFGGRFTFNLNDHIALEAEGNFYPRESFPDPTYGGYPSQTQFGAKVGKRWEKFGIFAKARPGFVSFSRVRQLVSTQTINFGGSQFLVGTFANKRKTYFSTDVGGVFELYPSRRIVTRFDFGDTIIRYSERHAEGFSFSSAIITFPAETRHNFQFIAGLGFRF